MNNSNKEDHPVDYIDKDDLKDHTAAIKEHISLLIAPIIKEQAEVKIILTGASKVNGLVGRIKTLSTNLKVIYGLLAAVTCFLVKIFVKHMEI